MEIIDLDNIEESEDKNGNIEKIQEMINEVSSQFRKINEGIIETFSNMKLPAIELPKINLPEIDYDLIRSITKNNSKYGWTLTGEIGLNVYLNRELLDISQSELDSYFFNYYMYKDSEFNIDNYRILQNEILKTVNIKWKDLLKNCFRCHELGMTLVAIPTLITIIEGELSEIANSNLVGNRLITYWRKGIDTDSDRFTAIALYSLYYYLRNSLFKTRDFSEERLEVINRNWVLHGRDDPSNWKVVDYFRLLNTLNSMQFAKEVLKKVD